MNHSKIIFSIFTVFILSVLAVSIDNIFAAVDTWTDATTTNVGSSTMRGVSMSDANNGVVVGNAGKIVFTTNGGVDWTVATSTSVGITTMEGVSMSDANNGVAVGRSGEIVFTTNGGVDWTDATTTSVETTVMNGVSMSDANNGVAVGASGQIVFTAGSSSSSSSSKSIGESIGTSELPSFTKFLAPNEFPLSIQGNNYAYDDFSAKKTTTLSTGEPIQIKILASDDGGGSDIKRISLYMNLHGTERELYQSNTAVSYNNYGEPMIRNSEGIFDTVDINVTPDGRKQYVTFDITFAKEMPLSDVIIQVVDEVNNSVQLRASDAIQVIKATPIEENKVEPEITIPAVDPKLKAQLQLPNWIKQTANSWSDGVISDNGFSKSLGYMIHNDVIKNEETKKIISQSTTYEDVTFVIPQYLKNNAGWLENDLISDVEFVNAIQFLLDNNHIKLEN